MKILCNNLNIKQNAFFPFLMQSKKISLTKYFHFSKLDSKDFQLWKVNLIIMKRYKMNTFVYKNQLSFIMKSKYLSLTNAYFWPKSCIALSCQDDLFLLYLLWYMYFLWTVMSSLLCIIHSIHIFQLSCSLLTSCITLQQDRWDLIIRQRDIFTYKMYISTVVNTFLK